MIRIPYILRLVIVPQLPKRRKTMMRNDNAGDNGDEEEETVFDPAEYDAMLRLERLESLEEDMIDLNVHTLDEVRARIAELHRQMDSEGR